MPNPIWMAVMIAMAGLWIIPTVIDAPGQVWQTYQGAELRQTGVSRIIAAIGTGTLHWNTCQPGCAAGNSKTFPVKITASDPRMCTVVVYPNGSNSPSQKIRGEVFSLIDIQSLQPGAPSFLTGDAVLKPCG